METAAEPLMINPHHLRMENDENLLNVRTTMDMEVYLMRTGELLANRFKSQIVLTVLAGGHLLIDAGRRCLKDGGYFTKEEVTRAIYYPDPNSPRDKMLGFFREVCQSRLDDRTYTKPDLEQLPHE